MRPHGRARIDPNDPRHTAPCQRCGTPYNRDDLSMQSRWSGQNLIATGFWVCQTCLDVPNPQERTLVLPPDPPPLTDALPPLDMDGP